jgi:hypothetical protein
MSGPPVEGGGFDELPPLDDEWINKAAKREESADERAARLRRIASEHDRLQRQMAADRQGATIRDRRDKWRPWIIATAVITALVLVFMIL